VDTPQAIVLGLVRGISVFLPVSSTGRLRIVPAFLGLDRTSAAHSSFLLSIPAVALSWLLELRHASEGGGPGAGATIVASVVSYVSIAFLLRFLSTHSARDFVHYRVVVGALALAPATTETIS
jgi:undecaprenyl-diphosphatase